MGNKESILYHSNAFLLSLLLFMGMLLLLNLGAFIGQRLRKKLDNPNESINGTVLAAVLGLFGFLLAFTFSMAGTRYEARRTNDITEANAIGTAVLRADLYPDSTRLAFRRDFKAYITARIAYFGAGADLDTMSMADHVAEQFGIKLWTRAATAAKNTTSIFPGNLMVPALNEMLDSSNANNYGEKFRVPDPIIILLFALSMVCAFFVGYQYPAKGWFNWTITTGFCFLCSMVIYITLDLDRPRTGLIRTHASHQAIVELVRQFDK